MATDDWALDHEPPAGGLQGLRARLDHRGMHRWWLPVAGLGLAAAAAVMLVVRAGPELPSEWQQDAALMSLVEPVQRGVTVAPDAVDRVALQQVPVATPGVVMVRIAGTVPASDPQSR